MIYIPNRLVNHTPVARHINKSKPLVNEVVSKPKLIPGSNVPMLRLSIGVMTGKEQRSIRELYEYINYGDISPRFVFPDTGFITAPVQQQFWELGKHRVISLPELIVAELSGWLTTPYNNAYLHSWLPRAIEKCRSSEALVDSPFRGADVLGLICNRFHPFHVAIQIRSEMLGYGYEHYVNLLSVRKRLGIRVGNQLTEELGREPTDSELKCRLHQDFDARSLPIAFKGWKDRGKRNFMADEELVVSAFITAIMTGQHTLVLTRDTDVFDQFNKLFELLVSDYYCYRFGAALHANPSGLPMQSFPGSAMDIGILDCQDALMIPKSEVERLPPSNFHPVHIFCALVGNTCVDPRISLAGVCLEHEMHPLLKCKSETGGKNSPYFPDQNIITGINMDAEKLATVFMRCTEEQINFEGVSLTHLDLRHALQDTGPVLMHTW